MIKIKLIVLGKLKEKYLIQACQEYMKRLSRYCDFDITEIEPVRISEKPSGTEVLSCLEKEAQMIKKKIPEGFDVISLCIEGKSMNSNEFAKRIASDSLNSRGIVFIVGSSYGLSEQIKNISDLKLSVSEMTFPHQLFRVMLLEQIYRAFKINEGSAYHK